MALAAALVAPVRKANISQLHRLLANKVEKSLSLDSRQQFLEALVCSTIIVQLLGQKSASLGLAILEKLERILHLGRELRKNSVLSLLIGLKRWSVTSQNSVGELRVVAERFLRACA